MNIALEKKSILKRFEKVNDPSLIKAIKNILDYGLKDQDSDWWDELSKAQKEDIDAGLKDIGAGRVVAHKEVMKKYKKWLSK
jgi:predicted transcriptional regulator